ncbi:DUF6541 family protein [Microbacterium sp.]|jgi:hypothetical protein|uniref:DUF6541 family protein n=1 Tax=Microbacterium sp. TaxID=51671 RepID=UPI0026291902|nr:DUF6541 family protein [Microbacterium sp.]
MIESWSAAIAPFAVATLALVLPGTVIIVAGWGVRRLALWFFAPALSLAVLAVASVLAGAVGLSWGPIPIAIVTVLIAAIAAAIRLLWVKESPTAPPLRVTLTTAAAFIVASAAIIIQLMTVFGRPENISQTFDAIVHLNTIRYTMDTANASAFHIGATSDIAFYPNAWHALVSLSGLISGASVPVAVNAANIALGAVAWPASVVALSLTTLGSRMAVGIAAAALSTGFGAFPILLFDFGVLYPNATAYAVLPAGLAAVWMLLRPVGWADALRSTCLLLVLLAGIGLAHPNAFLALYAMGAAVVLVFLLTRAIERSSRSVWITHSSAAALILLVGAGLWRFSRTGWDMSRWGAWQSTAQAFGEAVLISPRSYPVTLVTAFLLIAGLVAIARRPRQGLFALPFAVAAFMFVLVSGTPVEFLLREMVTNPWYNDSFRLAALLPVAGIPVAVFGVVFLADGSARMLRPGTQLRAAATVAAAALLFSVAAGPNVSGAIAQAQVAYRLDASAALLTADEAALIDRLGDETPPDAFIAGSPWTGTSLAYALAGRDVVELHVFGSRNEDEIYLDEHLRNIDSDPRVCDAVRRLGVSHVLDFGTQNVFNRDDAATERAGIQNVDSGEHLKLIDSQGDARLFQVVGC